MTKPKRPTLKEWVDAQPRTKRMWEMAHELGLADSQLSRALRGQIGPMVAARLRAKGIHVAESEPAGL